MLGITLVFGCYVMGFDFARKNHAGVAYLNQYLVEEFCGFLEYFNGSISIQVLGPLFHF